jgi:hypothetical protein
VTGLATEVAVTLITVVRPRRFTGSDQPHACFGPKGAPNPQVKLDFSLFLGLVGGVGSTDLNHAAARGLGAEAGAPEVLAQVVYEP